MAHRVGRQSVLPALHARQSPSCGSRRYNVQQGRMAYTAQHTAWPNGIAQTCIREYSAGNTNVAGMKSNANVPCCTAVIDCCISCAVLREKSKTASIQPSTTQFACARGIAYLCAHARQVETQSVFACDLMRFGKMVHALVWVQTGQARGFHACARPEHVEIVARRVLESLHGMTLNVPLPLR